VAVFLEKSIGYLEMKILQVLNHFLPQQTAGTEVYAWALSKELIKNRINVKVVIPNYGKDYDESYAYDGITVHQFAETSVVDRALVMGFREPEGIKNFVTFLKQEQPDIVHFHELAGSNGIGLTHVRAAKKTGAKIIMTFHLAGYTCATGTLMFKESILCNGKISKFKCSTCYLQKKGMGSLSSSVAAASSIFHFLQIDTTTWKHSIGTALGTAFLIERLTQRFTELIDLSDQVVCIANWYQEVLRINAIDSTKVSFIAQGLPTWKKPTVKPVANTKPLRLMFLGRISPFKGLHLLIEALDNFSATEIELSIFGNSDGTDYETKLRMKTTEKANIFWEGVLDQDKVQDQMQKHDLLCLCSTFSEMSPLVIQESKAAGLPVLASNVPGNREQIEDGITGILFKFNDPDSLRKRIKRVINDRDILDHMRKKINAQRGFSEVAGEYIELYLKTISN
jgi:glycosyltransferase involved in cell wall biosynthesis